MNEYDHLNGKQRQAVMADPGPLRIIAGAGTGKTTVLINRVDYLIRSGYSFPPESVLLLTFTNKAVRDMQAKAMEKLGKDQGSRLNIMTYHSFGFELIQENHELLGLPEKLRLLDQAELYLVIEGKLDDFHIEGLNYRNIDRVNEGIYRFYHLRQLERIYGDEKAEDRRKVLSDLPLLGEPDESLVEALKKACASLEEHQRHQGWLSYGDQISLANEILIKYPGVLEEYQNRYRCILVDEYQDTDEEQGMMVRLLAGKHRNITVVGDDDQAIYAFRDARPENLLDFAEFFPDTRDVVLDINYRSSDRILALSHAIIKANEYRIPKKLKSGFDAAKWKDVPRPGLQRVEDAADEQAKLLEVIEDWRKQGISYGDMAILVRKNATKEALYRFLEGKGIPALMAGKASLFENGAIRELLALLRFLDQPWDKASLMQILLSKRYGLSLDEVLTIAKGWMSENPKEGKVDPELWKGTLNGRLSRDFTELDRVKKQGNLLKLIDTAWDVLKPSDCSRDDFYYGKLKGLVSEYMDDFPKADLTDLLHYLERCKNQKGDSIEMEDFPEEDRIKIMTCHTAKGLEFRAIILPSLQEFRAKEGCFRQVEEERRLLYVAMTRAKEALHILYWLVKPGKGVKRYWEEIESAFRETDIDIKSGTGYHSREKKMDGRE